MTNEMPAYKFFDPQALAEIADNEEDIMLEIINEFISSSILYVNDIEGALSAADFKTTNFVAHKLKGALKFLGATLLADIAQEIEYMASQNVAYNNISILLDDLKKNIAIVVKEVIDYRDNNLSI